MFWIAHQRLMVGIASGAQLPCPNPVDSAGRLTRPANWGGLFRLGLRSLLGGVLLWFRSLIRKRRPRLGHNDESGLTGGVWDAARNIEAVPRA